MSNRSRGRGQQGRGRGNSSHPHQTIHPDLSEFPWIIVNKSKSTSSASTSTKVSKTAKEALLSKFDQYLQNQIIEEIIL